MVHTDEDFARILRPKLMVERLGEERDLTASFHYKVPGRHHILGLPIGKRKKLVGKPGLSFIDSQRKATLGGFIGDQCIVGVGYVWFESGNYLIASGQGDDGEFEYSRGEYEFMKVRKKNYSSDPSDPYMCRWLAVERDGETRIYRKDNMILTLPFLTHVRLAATDLSDLVPDAWALGEDTSKYDITRLGHGERFGSVFW